MSMNPICEKCQGCQLGKYKNFTDDQGKIYRDFSVNCSLIPENNRYLPITVEAQLSEEEIQASKIMLDPVEWVKANFIMPTGEPMIPRWYQEELLRCSSLRKVIRMGRRSGKTAALCMDCAHFAFTNAHKRVLIIAPYKAQVQEIFGRLKAFIDANIALSNSVARSVSSPYYEIALHNGTTIRGFTSGTKSGSGAASARGQDADRIYLDEADYLETKDLNAIIPITITNPDVRLWISSTPTGRRDLFYKWCIESPQFKEFYFPSSVLPHWDQIKDTVRADCTEDAWVHEYMALFGEMRAGVFQSAYVDRAHMDYEYNDLTRNTDWIYSIGVDWNKEHGTEIVTIGYAKGEDMFYAVDAINIPKQGFTQLAGLEEIIRLNAKWRPEFIYVDQGYGNTNIELLKKYGYDAIFNNPGSVECRLKTIVHAYDFGSKIDTRDPITKQVVKKAAKPFLVENAVRRFEDSTIRIPQSDATLDRQLRAYIIEKRTQSGVPVYGTVDSSIGDHRLDAFMLALIGFKLQMSSFGKPQHTTGVAFTGQLRTGANETGPNLPGELIITHSEPIYQAHKATQQKLKRVESNMPQPRYNENSVSIFSNRPVQTLRPGFMDDTEYRYQKTNQRSRSKKPSRSNF